MLHVENDNGRRERNILELSEITEIALESEVRLAEFNKIYGEVLKGEVRREKPIFGRICL